MCIYMGMKGCLFLCVSAQNSIQKQQTDTSSAGEWILFLLLHSPTMSLRFTILDELFAYVTIF